MNKNILGRGVGSVAVCVCVCACILVCVCLNAGFMMRKCNSVGVVVSVISACCLYLLLSAFNYRCRLAQVSRGEKEVKRGAECIGLLSWYLISRVKSYGDQ